MPTQLHSGEVTRRLRSTLPHELIFVFVCVVVLCCACDYLLPANLGLAIASVTYGGWSAWLGIREARATELRFNPLVTYQFWLAGTLGLSCLYVALNYSATNQVPFAGRLVSIEQVARGHAMFVVGAFAFYLGMKQFQPRETTVRSKVARATSGAELLTYFVVGALIQVFFRQVTLVLGSSFVNILTGLPLAALCIFAVRPPIAVLRSTWLRWTILSLGTFTLLLLYARGDSKMMLSFSFAPIAFTLVQRKRITPLVLFGIAFVLLYFLIIAPVVTAMRNMATRNQSRDEYGELSIANPAALGDIRGKLQTNYSDAPALYISSWVDYTMLRICDPVPAGVIEDIVNNSGFLWGKGMTYVPIGFIPRAIWNDKPATDQGRMFTAFLGMASDPQTATTSTGQTSPGELFWNFGWPGVIVGMYIVGATLSGVYWGAAGPDPTKGVLEMVAMLSVALSFVLGMGSVAGGLFVGSIGNGIFLRTLIYIRDRWLSHKQRHFLTVRTASAQRANLHASR